VKSNLTNTHVNYALPIEEVRAFLDGKPHPDDDSGDRRASRGDATDETTERPVSYTGIKLFTMGFRNNAAYVDSVAVDSPGARAGLRSDDLILAIDGRQIKSARDFQRVVNATTPGATLSLSVKRGDEVLVVPLTVEARKN
jgi:S1-C subfamily serine protease